MPAAVIGQPRNYFAKFKFIVEIDGFTSSSWQTCSELAAELATIEQWEGGAIVADKSPGRVKVSDITLERGATQDLDCWKWFKEAADMAANGGQVSPKYKRTLHIVAQDRDGSTLRRWRVVEAFPNQFVAGEWDNTADANVMEKLRIACKFFEPVDDQ